MDTEIDSLVSRVKVVDIRVLRNVCSPYADYFSEEVPDLAEDRADGLKRANIGAIITIEPRAAQPGQFIENWRLAPDVTDGIDRHYTKFFYTEKTGADERRDLFAREEDRQVLLQRSAALAETLDFANRFLKSPGFGKAKLVLHCIRAFHRSPVLTAGVLAHQLPAVDADRIMEALLKVSFQPPQLRMGEIAFIDAFLGRDGEMIKAWHRTGIHDKFDAERALTLHEKFSALLDAATPLSIRPARRLDKKL